MDRNIKDEDWIVLGLETSCDDTSAAVLRSPGTILSSVVSSQFHLHRPYGGVVPELASRAHIRNIRPVVREALQQAGVALTQVELVAVTRGPGLIGSLLVGLNYAKALAYALDIPFVGVNHLEGHFFSSFLEHPGIEFPLLCLLVSGGHSSLYHAPEPGRYELVAGTRDDAAGEAYDKVAKMLGLSYPGGPVIDRLASGFGGEAVRFRLPKISDGSDDYSFSGLKTSVLQIVRKEGLSPVLSADRIDERILAILKGFQEAVVHQLLSRVESALPRYRPRSFILGGGVACNSLLRSRCRTLLEGEQGIGVYFPSPEYTTDNAAMVALTGAFRYRRAGGDALSLNAVPSLSLG